jgi:tetratricopeptide (TPR) repeat protein
MESDLQKIQHLVAAGRAQDALPLALRFTQNHPDDPNGWYLLAGVHSVLGRLDEVIACCRRVTALAPDRFDALYNLGVALQQRDQLEEAVECYRRAVALKPDFAPAHANLGMALWKLKQLEEAEAASREALRLDPNQAQAGNNLGLVLRAQNRLDEAVAVLNDVIRRVPQMPEARYNLALCLLALDRSHEARAQLEEAVRLKPDYREAHADLGRLAFAEKRFPDASASFERACQLNPEDAEAWMYLAEACWAEEKFPEVLRAVERAVQLRPKWAEAHEVLGRAQIDAGTSVIESNRNAEKSFRKAIELKPDFIEAHLHLADSLRSQGKFQEALDAYRRALALAPTSPAAVGGAASMLEHLGQFEAARRMLAPVLEKDVDTLALALPYAVISRHTGEKDKAMALLERLLTDESSYRPLRVEGHFMLGKLYDSEKKYDDAFRHYRAANDLDPEKFDIEGNGRAFETFINYFDGEIHRRRPRASNRSRLPVFIVGMPRSGTSLTEQILASHPLVHGAGELLQIGKISDSLPRLTGVPWPECLNRLDRKLLDRIAHEHLDYLGRLAGGKARVTDKMPHNFRWLGLIDLLFPEARIIHCRRDPMDNCLSIYFQHFNDAHAYANNLEHLGTYYRQYERVVEHLRRVIRVPVLDMPYETTVAEPEQSARKLIEFCGLEWDDRCLHFHEARRVVTTPSYDQVRQPIYKKSVARWKHYEKFLEPLKRSLGYAESSDRRADTL